SRGPPEPNEFAGRPGTVTPPFCSDAWLATSDVRGATESGGIPGPPLVLNSFHINRRIAAQRSQFIVFGHDGRWLHSLLGKPDTRLKSILIDGEAVPDLRRELRLC